VIKKVMFRKSDRRWPVMWSETIGLRTGLVSDKKTVLVMVL